jgi:hypothetical protein
MNAVTDFVRGLFGPPRPVLPALEANNVQSRNLEQTGL